MSLTKQITKLIVLFLTLGTVKVYAKSDRLYLAETVLKKVCKNESLQNSLKEKFDPVDFDQRRLRLRETLKRRSLEKIEQRIESFQNFYQESKHKLVRDSIILGFLEEYPGKKGFESEVSFKGKLQPAQHVANQIRFQNPILNFPILSNTNSIKFFGNQYIYKEIFKVIYDSGVAEEFAQTEKENNFQNLFDWADGLTQELMFNNKNIFELDQFKNSWLLKSQKDLVEIQEAKDYNYEENFDLLIEYFIDQSKHDHTKLEEGLSVACHPSFGIDIDKKFESAMQISSGGLFFSGFLLSLVASPAIAAPVFLWASLLGSGGYLLSAKNQFTHRKTSEKIKPYSKDQKTRSMVQIFSNIALAGIYGTTTFLANGVIRPKVILKNGEFISTKGLELLIPRYKDPADWLMFSAFFAMSTYITAIKVNDEVGDFWKQPVFWVDFFVGYWLSHGAANLSQSFGRGAKAYLDMALINVTMSTFIDNWAQNISQLLGQKRDLKYIEFTYQSALTVSPTLKAGIALFKTVAEKLGIPQAAQLAMIFANLAIEAAWNRAMVQYVFEDKSYLEAFKSIMLKDLSLLPKFSKPYESKEEALKILEQVKY